LAGATFDKYMPDPVRNSCFLFPVTTSEIEYMIDKLNTSKSTGPFSIPTKLLKMLLKVPSVSTTRISIQLFFFYWQGAKQVKNS
jgi:hypothetical protein